MVTFAPLLSQASEKVKIRIWTDKEEYLIREPIFIHYEVKNISDSLITLNFKAIKDYFVIKDQKEKIFGSRLTTYYRVQNPNYLKSNTSYYEREEISDRYGITEPGEYSCYIQN